MYKVRNRDYDEDPNQKLGSGSEGAVYPFPGDPKLCVKLFHEPEPGDNEARMLSNYRAKKIAAICGMRLNMTSQFVMPLEPVFDNRGKVKGFLMSKVKPGSVKIMELLKQAWRASNNVGLKEIVLLFAKIHGIDLKEFGDRGLAVGDINLGCMMINPALDRNWVDMDSLNIPGYPCLATTELYAHPDLYPNLEKGKAFVSPTNAHDRFAMTVMFTQIALQGAHPFRMGIHPKFTSLRERAKNGVTILDGDVTYPKGLISPEVLSDALLDKIIKILKQQMSGIGFDQALLEFAELLTTCPQCGTDYDGSRAHCPKCHEKTIVNMTKLIKLLIETLYTTSSTMLRVQVIGKEVRIACRVQSKLQIIIIAENGKVIEIPTNILARKGSRFQFFADCLVVTQDPYASPPVVLELYCIEGKTIRRISDTSTGALENGQALDNVSERFLYRTAGNTLMCGRRFGPMMLLEERVAQVHQTQTWFTVDHSTGSDREALFGYDRALRDYQWFVIRGDKEGDHFTYKEVSLNPMKSGEKLVDFVVYFSKEFVLLVRKTELKGRDYVRYSLIRLDGKVDKDEVLNSSDNGFDCWENISGKLFQGDSVLHVTPKGIVKQTFSNNQYSHMEETEGVITITDRLFRCGTKVGVARSGAILTICRK